MQYYTHDWYLLESLWNFSIKLGVNVEADEDKVELGLTRKCNNLRQCKPI